MKVAQRTASGCILEEYPRRFSALGVALAGAALLHGTGVAQAGIWNQGQWGQMYWGAKGESILVAPSVSSVTVDATDVTITVADYAVGSGDDGWSRITAFEVSCPGAQPVRSSSPVVRIGDLDAQTQYQCAVRAINALGSSPLTLQLATTGSALLQGIPITLIYSALCRSANPPANCS